jgi:hypothetical protein
MDSEANIGIEGDSKGNGYVNEKGDAGRLQNWAKREERKRWKKAMFLLQHLVLHTSACGWAAGARVFRDNDWTIRICPSSLD